MPLIESEVLIWVLLLIFRQVMSNEEAVDSIKSIKDPQLAAKHLALEARTRKSRDDISCIVVRFQ